jgi:hypothetical protein
VVQQEDPHRAAPQRAGKPVRERSADRPAEREREREPGEQTQVITGPWTAIEPTAASAYSTGLKVWNERWVRCVLGTWLE